MTTLPPPTATTTYILDSNIFIEAKQRYYGFDVCPGFWDALIWQYAQGMIVSVDRVRAELEDFGDELSDWSCTQMPSDCFMNTDVDFVVDAYGEVIAWVMAQEQFSPEAKAEFADAEIADAWVIALAKALGGTVVTHEKPSPQVRRRVPIPNVCEALGVHYVDTFEMLRTLDTQFSWTQPGNVSAGGSDSQ